MNTIDSLNPMQKKAVCQTDGPLLILAGAGSGKTRVLTHRIAHLIADLSVSPGNILAITFTNKAAGEMRERVDNLCGSTAGGVWVATFHSTCVRILRRHSEEIGYARNFSIYDTDDSRTLMKQVLKRLQMDPKIYKERAMLSAVSSAKNQMISPEQMEKEAGTDLYRKNTALIYAEYQKMLKKNNAFDFDDLLTKTVELFTKSPEILALYQERFRYIHVDEYQDTNAVQFRLLALLSDKVRNLCVVGDDDQSIYKFRGADIQNILSFEKTFPDAVVIRLEQNYRSTTAILEAANHVIANNEGRKEKHLWSERGAGEKVRFRLYDDAEDEAEETIGEVQELVSTGQAHYSDCAVLYRTNAQSRPLEEVCVRKGIPYRLIGGINFYERLEIKDILAYLKTIDNGLDDLSVRRILNVPKRGIGQTTVNKVQEVADLNNLSFYEALKEADRIPELKRAAPKIAGFVKEIEEFRAFAAKAGPADLIVEVLEKTKYLDQFADDLPEEQEARRENLDELVAKAREFEDSLEEDPEEGNGTEKLREFLEEVALVADIDSLDEREDRMLLLTLHGAKGLEFSRVYIVGMEEGLFPGYQSIISGDFTDLEEERRLCYVGITRAKDHLTLSAAKTRLLHGERQYNPVSRFVKEIPEEMLDTNWQKTRDYSYSFSSYSGNETGKESRKQKEWETGREMSGLADPYGKSRSVGKEFTVTKADSLDYEVGDRVVHSRFGEGTVTEIKEGKRDYEVTVLFDKAGQKRMFASFAKLVKKRW